MLSARDELSRAVAVLLASAGLAACSSGEPDGPVAALQRQYSGEGVTLTVEREGDGYRGTLEVGGKTYPLRLSLDGDRYRGSFGSAKTFDVEVRHVESGIELVSAGKTRQLEPVAQRETPAGEGANPLAAAGSAAAASTGNGEDDQEDDDQPPATAKTAARAAGAAKGLSGRYGGQFQQQAMRVRLARSGGAVSGSVHVGTYRYTLSGSARGHSFSGRLLDPKMGGAIAVSGTVQGDRLLLKMAGKSFTLRRGARGRAAAREGGTASPPSGQRNRALVGLWSRTDSMSSGGVGYASKQYLEIRGNGTFRTGVGKTVAGGANWSMSGGGVEITGRGKWRTQGRIVHVNEGAGWQPYARFYTTGAKLMFTFGSGKREIWYRSR